MSKDQKPRFGLNSPGDVYVADGHGIACMAPEHESPELMSHGEAADGGYHCYFQRQPATPEEQDRAIRAVKVGCCGAVRYGGHGPRTIERLTRGKWPSNMCDHLNPPE